MALADLHLGATMVLMIHPNFRGKEGRIKKIESKISCHSNELLDGGSRC